MKYSSLKEYIFEDNHEVTLPFISTLEMNDGSTVKGVVIHTDKYFVSFYNLSFILNERSLYEFIEICLDWWWYSNQKIPINLFYPERTKDFQTIIEHYPRKGILSMKGHTSSLADIAETSRPYKRTSIVGQSDVG